MKILGLFDKLNRVTEIFVGILFVLPTFLLGKDVFKTGFTENNHFSLISSLPFLIFGIVILFPRKVARDMVIYFLVFFMAGLASLILAYQAIGNSNSNTWLLVAVGTICMLFSFKYLRKIAPGKEKFNT